MANGPLETLIATATLEFDIGVDTFPEHFVVKKKPTGPIFELHFVRHNSPVVDITNGFIQFRYLARQVRSANSEEGAKLQSVPSNEKAKFHPSTTKTIAAFVDKP